jgi:LPXTG-motif cell wall-anchored protein
VSRHLAATGDNFPMLLLIGAESRVLLGLLALLARHVRRRALWYVGPDFMGRRRSKGADSKNSAWPRREDEGFVCPGRREASPLPRQTGERFGITTAHDSMANTGLSPPHLARRAGGPDYRLASERSTVCPSLSTTRTVARTPKRASEPSSAMVS